MKSSSASLALPTGMNEAFTLLTPRLDLARICA